jgi:hypothetical protein
MVSTAEIKKRPIRGTRTGSPGATGKPVLDLRDAQVRNDKEDHR